MVRQYVGNHWSEDGTSESVPLNLISLYVSVVGRNLIAKNPRVMLSIFDRSLKPTVSAMQAWANKEIEHMQLQNTLQRVVVDALFSIGILKVALATPAESASVAWSLRAGEPFCERVDLDDFVFDVHARDFSEVGYIGHRYRVPLDVVKDSKIYSRARKDLSPATDQLYNAEGDERISVMGRGMYGSDSEEYEDFVDLWEVYLPRHRVVLTLADDQLVGAMASVKEGNETEPLRQQTWLGPDLGPYHILGYGVVPGNPMPKAPVQDQMDLHLEANKTYRKLLRQIGRMKEITLVEGNAMEDAERYKNANDGEMIPCRRAEGIKTVVSNGQAIQQVLLIATELKNLFSFMGGNLELLGGSGPQSKTAAQDELLNQNAGAGMADKQDRTVAFTASVLKALCWYWWHDPYKVQRSTHNLPSLPEMKILRQITPQMRKMGRFEDLDIQVDPYSMKHSTPETKLAALNQVVQTIVLPMMQLLQQQGRSFDINAYLGKVAQYLDMPDLAEIVTISDPPAQDAGAGGSGGEGSTTPPETTRNYVRESRPGRTQGGNDMDLKNRLMGQNMGGNPNQSKNGQPMGMPA